MSRNYGWHEWTNAEERLICMSPQPARILAKRLKTTEHAIWDRRYNLGLKRNPTSKLLTIPEMAKRIIAMRKANKGETEA